MVRSAFKIVHFLIALSANPTFAESVDFALVATLQTIGTWNKGNNYGDIRFLLLQEGYDHVLFTPVVDWTYNNPDTGETSIISSIELKDCDGSPVESETIEIHTQTVADAPVVIDISDGAMIEILDPGNVRTIGC
ncbi:hypothetical protein [Paracoccus marcusii]|uniref:hypothetical protein n=1 Tax=Paracoccus marcusii TaxID=59779 RepID=UPI0035A6D6D8